MRLTKPQQKIANDPHRFRVVISGRRFGKTFLSVRELCYFARIPNQQILYAAPSYRMAKGIAWDRLKERLISLRWVKKINESDLTILLVNGTKISLAGLESYDSWRGREFNFVVIDEFAMVDPRAWSEVLRATLSNTLGHALFISTPTGKSNWAYDMFVKHQEDPANWSSHQYTSLQGGNIPAAEIEQARRDLDERTFKQEYEASFEDFIGRIAWAFDREHNLKHIDNPDTRILHLGIDFNVSPITCAVHVKEGDTLFQIDEIVMYSSNTQELVDEILNRYPHSKIFVYPDPAGNQRKTSAGGHTDINILANAGFIVKAPRRHNLVKDRINSYNSRLCSADGHRHLYIDPKCKKTIESLEKFTYKEGTQVPDKNGYDHMFDAASYCVDYLFPLTREREDDYDSPRTWGHALA